VIESNEIAYSEAMDGAGRQTLDAKAET